jgi:putative Mn2+ efflux pump MntP
LSPATIAVIAVSMSVDAFAVSVGRGAAIGRPQMREALRTGIVFGVVEALTPLLGWLAGVAAAQVVEAVDHWIAFVLLAGVGLHMLVTAVRTPAAATVAPPRRAALPILIATAIGTSIDAMAVGASLAMLKVNIIVVAAAIGLATFLMSSGGMLVGRLIGERLGRWAAAIAGIALVGLGTAILVDHLGRV